MACTDVEAARALFDRRGWNQAHVAFVAADAVVPLAAEDLEHLAVSAYMLALDDEYLSVLERAHRAHLEAGDTVRAVRCAFWIGLNLMTHGAVGPARGWFGRAQRMLESEQFDCVERGYLVIPAVLEHVVEGDPDAAHDAAAEAAAIASRFGDKDLFALAVHEQGHALIRLGRVEEGLRLLDETMVSVVAGELSPRTTGIVYCNTIAFCQSVFEVRRAREWTEHLTRWCEEQPDMVAHTGVCLVHRAEIMELQGAWPDALEEARRAAERFEERSAEQRSRGRALALEGDLHRLQGRLDAAEAAYRTASLCGYEPQPGLALLRLAQGNVTAAEAAIRRALDETSRRLDRVPLLAACVEISVAAGDVDGAEDACRELGNIEAEQQSEAIAAMAARARGELGLARGSRARRSSRCARPLAPGKRSTRHTRRHAHGCSSRRPVTRSATRTRPPWSSRPHATSSGGSVPSRMWPRAKRASRTTSTGSRRASSRCSDESRPAGRTRRSRGSSSSASGRSTGT